MLTTKGTQSSQSVFGHPKRVSSSDRTEDRTQQLSLMAVSRMWSACGVGMRLSERAACFPVACRGAVQRVAQRIQKHLLIALWYLGSQESLRRLADMFGVVESTVLVVVKRICRGLTKHLRHVAIRWPTGTQVDETRTAFEARGFRLSWEQLMGHIYVSNHRATIQRATSTGRNFHLLYWRRCVITWCYLLTVIVDGQAAFMTQEFLGTLISLRVLHGTKLKSSLVGPIHLVMQLTL